MQREIHQDALGPVGVNLHSKYLLVAGYLRLTLILPSIATLVRIDDVFVQVEQTFELRSSKDPSASERHQQTIRLLSLAGRKGVTGVYQPGSVLSISEQFRVADDAKIRPSTAITRPAKRKSSRSLYRQPFPPVAASLRRCNCQPMLRRAKRLHS